MAHQRRRERAGDDVRRPSGLGSLGHVRALLLSLLVAGCAASEVAAPELPPSGGGGFGQGTSGGGGGTGSDAALVGSWERFDIAQFDIDIVTTTTRWQFAADGSCRRLISTMSANEGFPRTTERGCTWLIGPREITIEFADGGGGTFELSFPGFASDRMLLDGLEYGRVG